MKKLTAEEAFKTMIFFWEDYYEHKYLDYLGGILSEFLILEDGTTADTAAGLEWLECLEEALKEPLTEERKNSITLNEAYDAMYRLISRFSEQMLHPDDLIILLNDLKKYKEGGINSEMGKKWLTAVDIAIKDNYPLDVNNFKKYSQ